MQRRGLTQFHQSTMALQSRQIQGLLGTVDQIIKAVIGRMVECKADRRIHDIPRWSGIQIHSGQLALQLPRQCDALIDIAEWKQQSKTIGLHMSGKILGS